MALTKSLITGRVPLPTDEAAKAAEVTFTLSAWDTQGADVIMPASLREPLTDDASLPAGFALWRNTEGLRGSHYIVAVAWSENTKMGAVRREARLGNIQIGDLASYTLAELLERGIDPAPPSFWIAASAGDVQTIVEAANALDGYTEPGYLAEVQAGAASAATSETAAAGAAAQAQAAVDTATGLIITTFGNFDTLAQLVAAHPTAALNNTAFVRETGEAGTVHRWSGSAWVDTGESPLAPLQAQANATDQRTSGVASPSSYAGPPATLDKNGVELLGYDANGAAVFKIARQSFLNSGLDGLLGWADVTTDPASYNGPPPALGSGGEELFGFDQRGRFACVLAPRVLRQVRGSLLPDPRIALNGTSLMGRTGSASGGFAAQTVGQALQTALGREVWNNAVGGTDSYACAIRQGGRPFPLTLSGGQLPATTDAVQVTDWGGHDAYNGQTAQTRIGWLAGVPCVLTRTSQAGDSSITTGWTVARLKAGDAVPIPAGTPFIFEQAALHRNWIQIVEGWRNDSQASRAAITATRDNLLLMADYAGPEPQPRMLVIGPWPANGEGNGTNARTEALARRAELMRTFGPNFIDMWDYMVHHAIYDLGLTPTANDLADMAAGIVPRQLMDDGVHPNGAGHMAIALEIYRQIRSRGW